jgi:hypothetical protein
VIWLDCEASHTWARRLHVKHRPPLRTACQMKVNHSCALSLQVEDRDKLPWALLDTYSPWFWVTRLVAIVLQLLLVRWYLGWELSWFVKL